MSLAAKQLFYEISCELNKHISQAFILSTKTEKGNTQISERIIIQKIGTILDSMGLTYVEAGSQQSKDFRNVGNIDLNIEVVNLINQNPRKNLIEDFFKLQKIHNDVANDIGNLLDYCADRIIDLNPRVLGLSLLTQDSQFFTVWLCYHLKALRPDLKILIGGSGIKNFIAESTINFAELLTK